VLIFFDDNQIFQACALVLKKSEAMPRERLDD